MKLKRLLSLTMTVSIIAVTAAGCGKKDGGGDVFTIGGSGPLTGSAASYGISAKQGAELAVKEINDAGGVNGMKLSLNFLDDEAKAQPAIAAYNKVMDEGAGAILGAVTSDSMLAITELTNEDKILQVTPSASVLEATKYDNSFRVCFTDPLQGVTMADYAVETLGYKKLAVLYNVADTYSKGAAEAFIEEAEKKGAQIVAEESFITDDVDFNTQLTTIKGAGADALFLPIYYQDVAYIMNQAKAQGLTLPLLGSDGWDGVLNQLEDPSLANGAIFLSSFASSDPAENVQAFLEAYKEKYDADPDQFAADGYDGVYIIKAALEKAGSTDSKDLIAAMTEIEVDGVTGKMTFTPEGEPNKATKFIEIVDGKYQLME